MAEEYEWMKGNPSFKGNFDYPEHHENSEGLAVPEISSIEIEKCKCPNCKRNALFQTEFFWIISEDSIPSEDDCILKCWSCFQSFTFKFIKEAGSDGLSLQ